MPEVCIIPVRETGTYNKNSPKKGIFCRGARDGEVLVGENGAYEKRLPHKERESLVGVPGFEPGTSRTRTVRSSRAEPHPAGKAEGIIPVAFAFGKPATIPRICTQRTRPVIQGEGLFLHNIDIGQRVSS